MPNFFKLNPNITKPYALMDLDDTLFQTLRKIETFNLSNGDLTSDYLPERLTVASVNKQGEPLSYFTPKQVEFFNWLYHSTELIPVTARDTTEIQRVKLPFTSWQVLTHGAVILDKNGEPLATWQTQIAEKLRPLQPKITEIQNFIETNFADLQLRLTLHFEELLGQKLAVYLAIKHADKNHKILESLANDLPQRFSNFNDCFYIHTNSNNLAILPYVIHKCHAVEFLLEHHFEKDRASFGFGDSLADLPFLQLLDWYGTPKRGQLHEYFSQ